MTRQIRLTKIHALNWYGYHDSLPVSGNLLLAGVTGSGKSVLMDLMQLVLLGSQRARYNLAATGAASDRTLKGYCLGDTKEEDAGSPQYMRQSAITYAALEFTWPDRRRVETWGLRVEFASAAETSPRHLTPFFCEGGMSRGDFLDDERRPLSLGAFQSLVAARAGRCFRTLDEYRRDMAIPTHLNFDRPVMDRLLPMAMSFTFRSRFNDFCRDHILPAEAIDISQVTASYRAYRQYERDLAQLRDQLQRLEKIWALFSQHEEATREALVAKYLEQEFRMQHARDERDRKAVQLERLQLDHAREREQLDQLGRRLEELESEKSRVGNLIGETPDGKLYLHLREQNKDLTRQITALSEQGATAKSALAARVRNGKAWLDELRRLPLELSSTPLTALEKALHKLERGGLEQAETNLEAVTALAGEASNELDRAAAPTVRRLAEVRRQRGILREEIARLRMGRLPFPTTVLDALNEGLPWNSANPPARHLRELCEITDEAWRPALEVVFTRKFAIVVDSENYDEAEGIFHALKASDLGGEIGRESLLNPAKALALQGKSKRGSLAEKLRTEHPVAVAVIGHLFGDVICVTRREEFRQHEKAILPDGFMSRGAFVERRRFYDGNPFIGHDGLEQQRAWKEQQEERLTADEAAEAPLERAVRALQDRFGGTFRPGDSLQRDVADARRLPDLKQQLAKSIDALNKLDRQAFEELEQQLAETEQQLKSSREEQTRLLSAGSGREVARVQKELEKLQQDFSLAEDRFSRQKLAVDVTPHVSRLEEYRADLSVRFPRKEAAAEECREHAADNEKHAAALWPQVISERRMLAMEHNRYQELDPEERTNAGYEKHRRRIHDAEIQGYADKAQREQRLWEGLFREHVLEKMHAALNEVKNLVTLLNNFLKRPIGLSRYKIIAWDNKDFALQHRMLEASGLAKEGELFFASAETGPREAVQQFLKLLIDEPDSKEAQRLLDYRNYYEYDMEVHNVAEPGSPPVRVDRQSGKFSGGENQSPYFIAILASYLRAYRRHEVRRKDPTLALVPIDEAFSKLSGERIRDCVEALKLLDLQGVFSMSTGNIPYAYDLCDQLIVVTKHERREGRVLKTRNEPVVLRRGTPEEKSWLEMLGEDAEVS